MDSWGSLDILMGFEPADPRSNRGESVFFIYKQKIHLYKFIKKKKRNSGYAGIYLVKYQSKTSIITSINAYQI